jgi:hypothetical protein
MEATPVKVIFPEFGRSEAAHMGKLGLMTSLDRSTGQAEVTFDGGESATTMDACCLQYQDE